MWPATWLTSTAAAFGRLVVAGILPSALLVAVLWSAVASGAFLPDSSGLTAAALLPPTVKLDSPGVLVFFLFVAVLTAMLRSFQIPIVRLLEGYWGRRVPFAALSGAGVRRHVERRALVSRKYDEARAEVTAGLPGDLTDLPLPGQQAAEYCPLPAGGGGLPADRPGQRPARGGTDCGRTLRLVDGRHVAEAVPACATRLGHGLRVDHRCRRRGSRVLHDVHNDRSRHSGGVLRRSRADLDSRRLGPAGFRVLPRRDRLGRCPADLPVRRLRPVSLRSRQELAVRLPLTPTAASLLHARRGQRRRPSTARRTCRQSR